MPEDASQKGPLEFDFEVEARARGSARRSDAEAEAATRILRRWGVSEDGARRLLAQPVVRARMGRYCAEYPLNIAWYEARCRRERGRWRAWVGAAITSCVVPVAALFAVAPRLGPSLASPLLVPWLGALLVAAGGALTLVGAASDSRARFAGFWKAAADLKERLYTFEETWAGRPITDGDTLTDEFTAQLEAELSAGRAIGRQERHAFFATYGVPLDACQARGAGGDAALGKDGDSLAAAARAARSEPVTKASSTPMNGTRRVLKQ